MREGKAKDSVLKRSVHRFLKEGVQTDAANGIQKDVASSIQTELTTDPEGGMRCFFRVYNDLLIRGYSMKEAAVSILLPLDYKDPEGLLKCWMESVGNLCEKKKVRVLGGHTEFSRKVETGVVTISGRGERRKSFPSVQGENVENWANEGNWENEENRENKENGDNGENEKNEKNEKNGDIVMVGLAGAAGVRKEIFTNQERLERHLPRYFIEEAQLFGAEYDLSDPLKKALKLGGYAPFKLSDRGVYGALWEYGQSQLLGMQVEQDLILTEQHLIEICEILERNPYEIDSLGGFLITVKAGEGEMFCDELEAQGVEAQVIGRWMEGRDRVILRGEEKRFLTP